MATKIYMPLTAKQTSDKHWELMQSKGCKVIPAPAAFIKHQRQERMIILRDYQNARDEATRLKKMLKVMPKYN